MSSSITKAENYHRFLYETIKPHFGERIWEIGSGYGQYTKMLLDDGYDVLASDIDRELLSLLPGLRPSAPPEKYDCRFIDLYSEEEIRNCIRWEPDTIISLNVLEHIERDVAALKWLHHYAKAGTRIAFLTPAHEALYGFMDKEAGHFRRYTRATLEMAFKAAGWKVDRSFYLNPIGGIGWLIRNRILTSQTCSLDSDEVNSDIVFFDKYCVTPTKFLGWFTRAFFGQSVLVMGHKGPG